MAIGHFRCRVLLLVNIGLAGCQSLPSFQEEPLQWQASKLPTTSTHYFALQAKQDAVGELFVVESRQGDTLSDLARHYGLGFNEIALANDGMDPWTLREGQSVILPLHFLLPDAPRSGIVLNLASMRLFYFSGSDSQALSTYPVGIGREGWATPLGVTKIVAKRANPAWTVPESIHREHEQLGEPLPKVVPSGPDNPLGKYALPLAINGYLIHGTNKPYGIGMQVSHGCVQLYPEDIEELFQKVRVGTSVRIVHQPYLVAWQDDGLYLEAHKPLEKWAKQKSKYDKDVRNRLTQLASERNARVDWAKVDAILARADGIPTPVLANGLDVAELKTRARVVDRPLKLNGYPELNELTDQDWAVIAGRFAREDEAQKFAAMLNHQGPPIPARKVEKEGAFQVIAGPFKSKRETRSIAKRIKNSFDVEATLVAPKIMRN